MTIESVFVSLNAEHGLNRVDFLLIKHARHSPRDFFKLINDISNFFVSGLNDLEILREVPCLSELFGDHFVLDSIDDILIDKMTKFKYNIIQGKLSMLIFFEVDVWDCIQSVIVFG